MSDLISRQAVINAIANTCFWLSADNWEELTKCINSIPSVENKGEWIPVSERLPKKGEYDGDVERYYLVQNEFEDMMVARYTSRGYWEQIYKFEPIEDDIVAWQPLPEPYKEGGE